MSVCKHCGRIGGWHSFGCTGTRRSRGFELIEPEPKPEQEYRIEWTGNLKNYIPVKKQAEVIVMPSKDYGSDWHTDRYPWAELRLA